MGPTEGDGVVGCTHHALAVAHAEGRQRRMQGSKVSLRQTRRKRYAGNGVGETIYDGEREN